MSATVTLCSGFFSDYTVKLATAEMFMEWLRPLEEEAAVT